MTKKSFTSLKQLEQLSHLLPEDMLIPQEQDVPKPIPQEQDVPKLIPQEQDVPKPIPQEQDVPKPIPQEQDVPKPIPQEQDVPKPIPQEQDVPKPIPYNPEHPPVIGVDDIGGETAIADPTEALGYMVSDVVPQEQEAPKQVLGTNTNPTVPANSGQPEPVIPIVAPQDQEGPNFLSIVSEVFSNPNTGKGIVGDTTYKNISMKFTEANKTIDTLLATVKSGVPISKGVQKSAKGGMVTDTSSVIYHNPKKVEATLVNIVKDLSAYYTANKNNVSKEQGVELTVKITELLNKVQGTGSTLPDLNRNILIDAIRNLAVDTASFVASVPEAVMQGMVNIIPNVDPNIMRDSGFAPSEQISSLRRNPREGEGDAAMWAQLGLSLIPAMLSGGAAFGATSRILSTITSRGLMQTWALNAAKVVGPAIAAEAVGSITLAALNDAHTTIANDLVAMGVEADIAKELAINPDDSRWDRFIKSVVADIATGAAITPVVEGLSKGVQATVSKFTKLRELSKKAKILEESKTAKILEEPFNAPITPNTIDTVDTNVYDLVDTDEDFIDPFRGQRGFMDLKFMKSILEYIKPTLPEGKTTTSTVDAVKAVAEDIRAFNKAPVSIMAKVDEMALASDGNAVAKNAINDTKDIRLYLLSHFIQGSDIGDALKSTRTHSARVAELNNLLFIINPNMNKVLTGLDISSSKVNELLEYSDKFLKSNLDNVNDVSITDFIDKVNSYKPSGIRSAVSGVIQKSNIWLLADPINRLFDFGSGAGQHFVENFATAIGSASRLDKDTLKVALKGMAASPFVALNHSGKHGAEFMKRVFKHKGLITPGRVITDEALAEGTSKLNKWIQTPYRFTMKLDEVTKQNIYWTTIKNHLENEFPGEPGIVADKMLKFGNPTTGYRYSQSDNYIYTSFNNPKAINEFLDMGKAWEETKFTFYKDADGVAEVEKATIGVAEVEKATIVAKKLTYEELDNIAEEAALRATLQQDPRGLIGAGTKQLNKVVGNVPELALLWKFFRTGSNLLQQVHTLGPTGAISAPIELALFLGSKKQKQTRQWLSTHKKLSGDVRNEIVKFGNKLTPIRNEIVHDLINGSDVQKSRALGLYVISVAASTSAILAYLGMSDEEFEKADPKNSTVSGRALPAWQNARRLAYEGVRAIRSNKDSQVLVGTEWWEDVAIGSWGALKDLSYNHPIAKPLVVDPEFSAEYDQEGQFYDTAIKTALQSLTGSVMAFSGPIGMAAKLPVGPVGRSVGGSLGWTKGSSATKAVGLPSTDSPMEFGRALGRKAFDSTGFKGYEAYDSDMDNGIGESDLFGTGFRRSNIGERIPSNKSIALEDPIREYIKDISPMGKTIKINENLTIDLSEYRHQDGLSVYEAILDKANSIKIEDKTLRELLEYSVPILNTLPELKNKDGSINKKSMVGMCNEIAKEYYDAAKKEILSEQADIMQIIEAPE